MSGTESYGGVVTTLGGQPVGAAVGVQGFDVTNFSRSAANQLLGSVATGFGVAFCVHVLAVPSVCYLFGSGRGNATRGFTFRTNGAPIQFQCINGAAAAVTKTGASIVAGDVGKVLVYAALHDGTALRLFRAGVEDGVGQAIVGYTQPNNTDNTAIGTNPFAPSGSASAFRVLGALSFTGVPAAADILAHYNACKAANTMESMTGAGVVNVNRWQAKDNLPNAATWVDDISGMVLTKTGTLSSVIFAPTWE